MEERRSEDCPFATNAAVNFRIDGEAHRPQLHNASTQGCMTASPVAFRMNGRNPGIRP